MLDEISIEGKSLWLRAICVKASLIEDDLPKNGHYSLFDVFRVGITLSETLIRRKQGKVFPLEMLQLTCIDELVYLADHE